KGVVEADVEFAFVQPSDRDIGVVETQWAVIGVGGRIELDHLCANRVEHIGWDLVARHTPCLSSIAQSRKGVSRTIALEGSKAIGVGKITEAIQVRGSIESSRSSHTERIRTEIATQHCL